MDRPILSIVIANYNYGRFLEEAIRSVIKQGLGKEVELIICDGGSTDNSVDIIKKYSNHIAWWCSEKDKGQSDAFNKGFSHASGKYLTWLNADDLLVSSSLRRVLAAFNDHPECHWFTGNFFRFTNDGSIIKIGWGPHYLPYIFQTRHQPISVYGPSSFFSKEIYEKVGRIKEYQHYMMDTDLWMRFIVAGVKQRRVNCFCWAFRMHEESKTAEFGEHKLSRLDKEKFNNERERALRETMYAPSTSLRWIIQFWRIIDGSLFRLILMRLVLKKVAQVGNCGGVK